jgi:hypothetical protein
VIVLMEHSLDRLPSMNRKVGYLTCRYYIQVISLMP